MLKSAFIAQMVMLEISFITLLMMLKRSSIALMKMPKIQHLRADDAANISFVALTVIRDPFHRADDDAQISVSPH